MELASKSILSMPGQPFRTTSRDVGVVLQRGGAQIDRIWIVRSGRVVLRHTTEKGRVHACTSVGAGACVGLEGLAGSAAQRSAVVTQTAELGVAPLDEVERFSRDGEAARLLLSLAAAELTRSVEERVVPVGSSQTRVARFLLSRARVPLLTGWVDAPLTDVACLLAMRPETLSRALQSLEVDGYVARDGRGVRIIDEQGLARLAEVD